MTREELIKDEGYVTTGFQLKLLNLIEDYMEKNNLNRDKLAKKLGVTKGYISQLLNASYDHKISKLVNLALACDTMPLLFFVDLNKFITDDASDKIYDLMPVMRPKNITFDEPISIRIKETSCKKPPVYTPITETFFDTILNSKHS